MLVQAEEELKSTLTAVSISTPSLVQEMSAANYVRTMAKYDVSVREDIANKAAHNYDIVELFTKTNHWGYWILALSPHGGWMYHLRGRSENMLSREVCNVFYENGRFVLNENSIDMLAAYRC